MSFRIPLQLDAPNQSLSFTEGASWSVALKSTNNSLVATIQRDGVTLIEGVRIVAGEFIIPYPYLSIANFYLETQNNQLPDYTLLGTTQFLIFMTEDEVRANG